MENIFKPRTAVIPLVACGLLLLSACVTTAPKAPSIEERAIARWESLFAGEFTRAYEYLSPGYRSSVTAEQYEQSVLQKRIKWVSARYIESECTETSCKVKINIGYTASHALAGVETFHGRGNVEETWLQLNGQWYLVPAR